MAERSAARKPTAKGRPAASRPANYHWRLPQLMEERGLRSTVELGPLLAERGVVLSDAQVYRLAQYTPERLSLKTLSALCDIFECTPNDLVVPFIEGARPPLTTVSDKPKRRHSADAAKPAVAELPESFTPVKADLGSTRRRR
ncbi:helix-turn-helix domain-containing protein [Streptomyces sp. NPDC050485]|uniref:helix-turn-helix domain-containing protein n=1 Tax=Streptomyces sp. NPDC050485 TaxID=3365617 RepID=UPI00379378D6